MDTIEKPVVDELIEFDFTWDEEEQCSHSEHSKFPIVHHGPAAWWQHSTCPHCGNVTKGYRCDLWVKYINTLGFVHCNHNCQNKFSIDPYVIFTPLDRKKP